MVLCLILRNVLYHNINLQNVIYYKELKMHYILLINHRSKTIVITINISYYLINLNSNFIVLTKKT